MTRLRIATRLTQGIRVIRVIRAIRLSMCAVLLLSLFSCMNTTTADSELVEYGALTLFATSGPASTAKATTTAIFFEAFSANVPDSRNQANYCQYSSVDTTNTATRGALRAGTSLTFQFGTAASATLLVLPFDDTNKRYASAVPTTYQAGDSIKVSVPGEVGGFPASSISLRLAEPLFPAPLSLPPAGQPLLVQWNASSDTTTAIIIAIKYANPSTSLYPNEQILCSLKDDGSETIPGAALAPVLASPANMRSLLLTRWRTNVVRPTGTTLLHIVSSVDTLIKLP